MNRKVMLKALTILTFITSLSVHASLSEKFDSLKNKTKDALAKVTLRDVAIGATGVTLVGLSLFLAKKNLDLQRQVSGLAAEVGQNKTLLDNVQIQVSGLPGAIASTQTLIQTKADEFCHAAAESEKFGQEVISHANQAFATIYMRLDNHKQWLEREDAALADLVRLVNLLQSFHPEA